MGATPVRANLRRLVRLLPESELETAERVLRGLLSLHEDPFLRALAAARPDDEPMDEEDLAAENEADQAISEGRLRSHDDLTARFGR